MAIIVEEEEKNSTLFKAVAVLIILLFLGLVTYYLFFKPVPGIEEVTVSPVLQSISKVSKVSLDVEAVTSSPIYQSLVRQVNAPDLGVFGRSNPFAPF